MIKQTFVIILTCFINFSICDDICLLKYIINNDYDEYSNVINSYLNSSNRTAIYIGCEEENWKECMQLKFDITEQRYVFYGYNNLDLSIEDNILKYCIDYLDNDIFINSQQGYSNELYCDESENNMCYDLEPKCLGNCEYYIGYTPENLNNLQPLGDPELLSNEESSTECCKICQQLSGCNVWIYKSTTPSEGWEGNSCSLYKSNETVKMSNTEYNNNFYHFDFVISGYSTCDDSGTIEHQVNKYLLFSIVTFILWLM